MDDPGSYLAIAHRLADAAGEVIRPRFRTELNIETKADESPVTIADREAESAMRAIIEKEAPRHGIRGEELPDVAGDGEWCWYLDPIDGTKLFISGIPLFGTLIALARNGNPLLGIIDQPITQERWVGSMDGTATLNSRVLATTLNDDLSKAKLFTTSMSYYSTDQVTAFERLSDATGMTRMGMDCYAFAMLASGFVDIVTEGNVHEWDVAAHVPIIENAGGVVTDWNGSRLRFEGQVKIDNILATANPALHAKALAILKK